MVTNTKELINKIKGKELREFFHDSIQTTLNKFELTRQIILSISYSLFIISLTIKYLSFTEIIPNNFRMNAVFALLFLIAFIPFSYNDRYKKLAKNIFLDKILNFIGEFKLVHKHETKENQEAIKSTGIVPNFKYIEPLTIIDGKYNGRNIEIQELSFANNKIFASSFGLLITIYLDKDVCSHTILSRNVAFSNNKIENMKEVSIFENTQFGNVFRIFSNNEEMAKNFLSNDIIDNFIKLHISANREVNCAFINKKLYIFIENFTDFDMPFFKSVNQIKDYQDMLESLVGILSITDVLNNSDLIQKI